ncbi:hypothetical protein ACFRKB_38275 [Streptomyces scopuliridis]|uniref:hypothetical protein n=1 Tax=Streptomyces scopuliridis TaxID=452529 RepID=UPI0036C9201E
MNPNVREVVVTGIGLALPGVATYQASWRNDPTTAAGILTKHPQIEVICRDRSGASCPACSSPAPGSA